MAVKRMFSNKVLDTDAFLDMPLSAQALYFHLNLRADDDGFISNPKRIQGYVGASEDDLKLLVLKRFLIAFEDGAMVIKHWRMHNTIRKDRYTPTAYIEDLSMLGIKENDAYTLDENQMLTKCIQNGNQMETKWQPMVSTDIDIDKDIDIDIGIDKGKGKKKKEKRVWYPEDEALNDAFERYIEHRKKMKKSMSEYACERAMSKLEDLSQGDNDVAIAIIEQSIKECWQGLFALKEQPKKKSESVVDDIAAALKELTGEDL